MTNEIYSSGNRDTELQIGRYNRLTVKRDRDIGLFLEAGRFGTVLLPRRYVPEGVSEGDEVDVFVYLDSEDDLIATTVEPLVQVGGIAALKVVSTGPVGAFLDWGLPKDLLLPFQQQRNPVSEGQTVIVAVYLDNTNRIAASTKLDRFLNPEPCSYRNHHKVNLLIAERTDLGVKAIVDQQYWGLVHNKDLFRKLHYGQPLSGYIKQVRSDGKIDLLLEQPGFAPVTGLAERILQQLQQQGGFLPLSDRSDPELIKKRFGVSKKKYKMAIGTLYKQRRIDIEPEGIRLIDSP
ncbi:GntR family transcriptional regulator [Motiliproteus coralliicola]|uniref:GntR family transcriptional regulator n=1 Tax=Motiliproteus coralliicola TaxID=2283196 RepID=A0A369WCT7_9GAMM|nr:S1-like domain-containing RNA-binding protein [Motiliproteus coralliicola]RDE19552.1 GntR family transcriptional regulator [Motiliproteus coralliicola]